MSNELGRLSQRFGETKGNNTFFLIPKINIPKGKIATCIRKVRAITQHKKEPYRVIIIVGVNIIFYPGEI